jgi:hypothetical protein
VRPLHLRCGSRIAGHNVCWSVWSYGAWQSMCPDAFFWIFVWAWGESVSLSDSTLEDDRVVIHTYARWVALERRDGLVSGTNRGQLKDTVANPHTLVPPGGSVRTCCLTPK